MDIGELLYDKLESARIANGMFPGGPWIALSLDDQRIFSQGAQLFLRECDVAAAHIILDHGPATPERDWKAVLTKFGRHSPGCSPYGLCNCGYAEIEKELGT